MNSKVLMDAPYPTPNLLLITYFINIKLAAMPNPVPTQIPPVDRLLTAAAFQQLADVPPAVEWFPNLPTRHTRRAYENAVKDFMRFADIRRPEEFRVVTRAHVIAWRDDLETRLTRRGQPWNAASIR